MQTFLPFLRLQLLPLAQVQPKGKHARYCLVKMLRSMYERLSIVSHYMANMVDVSNGFVMKSCA